MGKVYILTNDAMPGIIKIGVTEDKIENRMKTLDNTSVPLPFRFYFAVESDRYNEIESLLHDAFAEYRIRDNREFFKIDPERAVSALKISGSLEIKMGNEMVDSEGKVVKEKKQNKAKRYSFSKVGIELGTLLEFTRNEDIKCKVVSDSEVEYNSKKYSLTSLAKILIADLGYKWKSVQGPNFFKYNDKTLYALKKEKIESELDGE